MNSSPRLLVLGHAAHDLVYRVPSIPERPVKVVAMSFYECGGGMAANACVAIARLGGFVSYWGRVADDPLGQRITADLAAEHVDVSVVRRVPGCRSPVTSILVSDTGERLICSFTDPDLDADPGWLPIEQVPSFAVAMVDVRWPRGAAAVLDAARAAGRPALLDADVAHDSAILDDLISRATHVLFSETGLAVWAREAEPGAALRRAQREHHAVVGATLGSDGFVWLEGGTERRVPAPRVEVLDTLAAGDVWHGAFALAVAERQDLGEAAAFANAAAAIKCQRRGGRLGAPTRDEVENALRDARRSVR